MTIVSNLDKIKDLPIEDVVGKYVNLKKAGTRWVACCPFHNERSASFGVSPSKGIYKCFGCGESGDGIDFVMKHENLSFLEAVERIAGDQSVRLDFEKNENWDKHKAEQEEERKKRESLFLGQEWAAKTYFENTFPDWKQTSDLEQIALDARPLSFGTIRAFEICYTGDNWNFLRAKSMEDGWGLDVLLETGLLKEGREGSGTYDGFAKRYLFPIRNHQGKLAGFGARINAEDAAKPDNKRPKYLNSPDHPAYKKSEILYGLWQNKRQIGAEKKDLQKSEGFAYIVEGYMDVVTMAEYGIRNAVAPCGTALTNEQIDLLKKHTDHVVLCFDSDPAGEAATAKSVDRLLQKGFRVDILLMPAKSQTEKHDPDSYLRKHGHFKEHWKEVKSQKGKKEVKEWVKLGEAGWFSLLTTNIVSAIEWMVLRNFKPEDPYSRTESIQTAARLLGYLDSEILVNRYLETLCTRERLGNCKRDIRDAIGEARDEFLQQNRYQFNETQQRDRLRYGIYVSDNKFWQAIGDGEGYELTNFVVEPIMCVIGQNRSLRLVKITNEDGMTATIEMDSDEIIELSTFKKVVGRKGNFVFKASCKAEHFARIQAKILAESPNVYPIYTMGMHEMPDGSCFYAFSNAIVNQEGVHFVDDFGAVEIGDVTYYLPAYSKVRIGGLGEQATESFDDIKPIFYPKIGKEISFEEWTLRIKTVYGKNGMVGAAWALAAMHRDIIFRRFKMFPHLNLFGVPQSGKNQLAGSLTALFGMPQPPIGLENATKAAMTRLVSVIRNGIVWFDEYKNDVDRWIVEILKGFADGTSRRKGDANMENRTISTPVNSAAIISGQHQLTLDIAMFSRTISLNFSKTTYTEEERTALRELVDIQDTGILTRITATMHGYRDLFAEKFASTFEEVRSDFSAKLPTDTVISDRVLNMFCIPLTAHRLLSEKEKFAFTGDELRAALLEIILTQRESMFAENEVSIFWRIIEFLLQRAELRHGQDIIVEIQDKESFDLDWSPKAEKRTVNYIGSKKLVYLYFGVSHPLYMKQHMDERRVKGLDKQALFLYLKSHEAFEGLKRAKKFSGVNKCCFVFDADKLPFELPLTMEVLAREARRKGAAAPDGGDGAAEEVEKCATCLKDVAVCKCHLSKPAQALEDAPF